MWGIQGLLKASLQRLLAHLGREGHSFALVGPKRTTPTPTSTKAGHGWPWPSMAGQGRPWPAMAMAMAGPKQGISFFQDVQSLVGLRAGGPGFGSPPA